MEGSLKNIKRPGVNLDLDEYLKEYTKESFYEKLPVVSLWKLRILTKKKSKKFLWNPEELQEGFGRIMAGIYEEIT